MCGFAGRIVQNKNAKRRPIMEGLRWLARRGPDSQRTWSSPDGSVELLHARLAIVNPSDRAHQPFVDETNQLAVVVVGEIYNYLKLALQYSDYNFRARSDSELVLAVYAAHGIEGLKELRGMFVLALVDMRIRKVILARDPIGKKPLFVAHWGDEILFGTSLISLVAIHGHSLRINEAAAEDFWQQEYITPHHSALVGARPVLPGKVIVFSFDGGILNTDSCVPPPAEGYKGENLREVRARLDMLLKDAVTRRLQNNSRPNLLLSGGIDSTTIASVMTNDIAIDPNTIQALTLGSLVPLTNDELYARYAAHRLRLPLKVIRPHKDRFDEMVADCFNLQDEPLGMLSFFALYRLIREIALHSRIVLGGDGGDEVFLGYGVPQDWMASGNTDNLSTITCGPPLPDWMSSWGRNMVTNNLVGHMFAKMDRASAEQAVEVRCPLLDWDLVSYVRTLPPEIIFFENRSKSLLKTQLQGWPSWFINRRKLGFAYNLRWAWLTSGFAGLREMVDITAIERFESYLPAQLCSSPSKWRTKDILHYFISVWKLIAWSRFMSRFSDAEAGRPFQSTSAANILQPGVK